MACQMSTLTFEAATTMIKIDDEAITFVVQGPVQASASRQQIAGITEQCLNSIRRFFPKSTIILSTWKGQPLDGLDYDQVLELDDPGANTVFMTVSQLNSIITVRCTAPTWG